MAPPPWGEVRVGRLDLRVDSNVYRRVMTVLRIAEVAARSGVPATTLRYYDQLGLVPSERSGNGYRAYSGEVFDRLRFIDAARRLDLPLDEIAGLLRSWERDPCMSVKAKLRPLIDDHLHTVDDTISALRDLREHLASARAHLDELPDSDGRCDPSCAFLLRETPPVACSLGDGRGEQVDRWRALLDGHPVEAVPGGVQCRLPISLIGDATGLAAAEQLCCPFLSFDIVLQQQTFVMTIGSPAEGLPLLAELTGLDGLSPRRPVGRR